ncbi:MAG: penicillin acylase family protein [Bacteroidota bacterium]
MKMLKFILVFTLNVSLIIALNISFNVIPPLGFFLSPTHGFWQNAENVNAHLQDELNLAELEDKVSVIYDTTYIPHIFAENDHDLYFAQGYITAKHRLWQMEFQTHFAAGRISEIVGEKALPLDRETRRKGMAWAAERATEQMLADEEITDVVTAYSAGVNAYISSLSDAELPLEYKLLDYKPEPWSPVKSAFLLKYMSNNLSFRNSDFEYTNAVKVFGKELFNFLYPDIHPEQEPIVTKPNKWNFEPKNVKKPEKLPFALEELQKQPLIDLPNIRNGSNNWAVAGEKTKNGNPILCGDPHLGLNLPSIWFAIQLSAPGINVKGVSLPGSPNIIIGFNEKVAWSVTNAMRDVVDWYKIQYKDAERKAYLLDGDWKPVTQRIEEIKIKGKAPFYDTLNITEWGPVMYDASYPAKTDDNAYALRWIAHDPSLEIKTFYMLNRASNYQAYRKALEYYQCPAQNFVFASTTGDIAMVIQGKFPIKWEEQGKFLMDGTTTDSKWQGYIPNEHNVFELNPAKGFVGSANQHPVDTTYPYYVYSQSFEYYRNRRINDLLDSLEAISLSDMMRMQNDNFNGTASENLPFLLNHVENLLSNEEERKAFKLLASWNFVNSIDTEAASYFEEWQDALKSLFWDEMKSKGLPLDFPSTFTTFKILKTHPSHSFIDILSSPEKEEARDLVYIAFQKAIKEVGENMAKEQLKNAQWSNYKATTVTHLARLPAFSEQNVAIGGNHNIINATSERHGASWRMVVELSATGPEARAIYPGGQSGNPGSPFYTNFLPAWAKGEYIKFNLLDKNMDLTGAFGTLQLRSE